MTGRSRVRPHAFEDDAELQDPYVPCDRRDDGPRRWCARCGLPGEPGDARHPPDAEDAQRRHEDFLAAAAEVDRRRTGEH
ncbi:hypothetical protein L0U85_01785 [Glycomyces sp. L485]|uniref:hypothetical protein n=1 Tax=Glycomyces sp. L485 TaxID=2909235 RepID=UPI001F4AC1B6|nr:hypothetical protein [Glycomyces sp. L485]MCH7229598.1 hypothetical protein [Glycomyces sp. L485]